MLKIELATTEKEIEKVYQKWATLHRNQKTPSLHNHPDLYVSNAKKNKDLALIILKKGVDIQCIAPCYKHKSFFRLKLGLFNFLKFSHTQLTLFGSDLLFVPESDTKQCANDFFSFIKDTNLADALYIETVAENSELSRFLHSSNQWSISHADENNIIRQLILPPSHDEYLAQMKRKVRYNIKRTVKQFTTAFENKYSLIEYSHENSVEELLTKVDYLYSKSWQSSVKGYHKRNSESSIQERKQQAKNGWLRSFILEYDNTPIAFVIGTQYHGFFDYEETGYDPIHTDYSPGSVLTYLLIERLFKENKPNIIDFGYGENVYKKVFGNSNYTAYNIFSCPKSSKLNSLIQTQKLLNKTYSLIRNLLVKLNLDVRIRKLLKNK